jgi:hypothetical protein
MLPDLNKKIYNTVRILLVKSLVITLWRFFALTMFQSSQLVLIKSFGILEPAGRHPYYSTYHTATLPEGYPHNALSRKPA